MKAVVMAGGEGTRLRPMTANQPKPLLPVVNRPIMEHVLRLLKRHGMEETVVTVQFLAALVRNYFGDGEDVGMSLQYATEETPLGTAGSVKRLGSPKLAYAAVVRSHAAVYRRPGAPAFARFGKLNINGVPTIFWIRGVRLDAGCKPRQYLVQSPKRPNGMTAWVPARQVEVERVTTRIVVDLSAKRVTLFNHGRRVLSSKAAIGAAATAPTRPAAGIAHTGETPARIARPNST